MTWIAYVAADGRPVYELSPFVPAGARVISGHADISGARDAVEAYKLRQEREALEAAGQLDMFGEV